MRQRSALWIYPEVKQQLSSSTNSSTLTSGLELRNTIYSYCKKSGDENFTRQSPSVHKIGYRTYFHLCQVNYQIRQEALPLQYQNFTHRVPLKDLAAYMETFLLPHKGHSLVGSTSFTFQTDRNFPRVNIAPLIRVCKRYPKFAVSLSGISSVPFVYSFRSYHYPKTPSRRALDLDKQFQELIKNSRVRYADLNSSTISQRRWSKYLGNSVEELWIHSHSELNVDMIVKSEASEPWMDDLTKTNCRSNTPAHWHHYKKEYKAWVYKNRFPGFLVQNMFSVKVSNNTRV